MWFVCVVTVVGVNELPRKAATITLRSKNCGNTYRKLVEFHRSNQQHQWQQRLLQFAIAVAVAVELCFVVVVAAAVVAVVVVALLSLLLLLYVAAVVAAVPSRM